MADTSHVIGSTGIAKKLVDLGDGTYADAVALTSGSSSGTANIGEVDIDVIALYPVSPVVSVFTPTGAAYMKYTPNAANLDAVIRSRVTSEDLIYAGIITHKIADSTTTLGSADATDLASSKTLADEALADVNTHFASTTYHVAADDVWYAGHKTDDTTNTSSQANMSNLATGYTLADELDDDYNAHVVSTTFHTSAAAVVDFGGTPNSMETLVVKVNLLRTAMATHFGTAAIHGSSADTINAALVNATTVATDEASAQTLINLLKTYWNSHCAVGDATADDLAAVVVCANSAKAALLGHFADTASHGGISDAADLATLTAVAAASDQATANTLLTAIKTTYNLHCAKTDNGSYQTVPAGSAIHYPCAGALFVKTSVAAGTWTVAEYRSS